MRRFRLLRSQPMSAADNMALDAAILARYLEEDIPVLRLYRWLKPSFTYGVSQDPADEIDIKRCTEDGIGVAGRMTGGGVLFHNDDITYSFVCGKEDVGEPKAHLVSYREISAFLIRFYASLGLKASFALEAPDFKNRSRPHELCAASCEKYDILVNGKKIGGNAQKRKKSAIFQHGSIPCAIDWELSARYLKSPVGAVKSGVTSLSGELGCVPNKSVLENKLIEAFGDTFGVKFIEESWSNPEISQRKFQGNPADEKARRVMKPEWLNKKIDLKVLSAMKSQLRQLGVETVCEEALCPNAGECFGRSEATFLILGRHCTRACSFCNIDKSVPLPPDKDEPGRVAEAVKQLGLKHVVVTSVTRDDLPDGGAKAFADTVLLIRKKSLRTTIEVLVPDFKLSLSAIETVIRSKPDIFAHNVETVPSLYSVVRQGSDYSRSLEVLRIAKEMAPEIKTKSGIMLGLGEKEEEVLQVIRSLRSAGCDFLSIGQYLAPSLNHYPVKEYVAPEKFKYFKEKGTESGFLHIESGPYVRSSYMAGMYL